MTQPPTFAELRDDMARTLQGTAPPGLTWERAQKMASHLIEKYKTSRPRSEFTPIDAAPSDTPPSTETPEDCDSMIEQLTKWDGDAPSLDQLDDGEWMVVRAKGLPETFVAPRLDDALRLAVEGIERGEHGVPVERDCEGCLVASQPKDA